MSLTSISFHRKGLFFSFVMIALLFSSPVFYSFALAGPNGGQRVKKERGLFGEPVPPGFAKIFLPDVIGPGSTTRLRFEISNNTGFPIGDLAFTDTLPTAPGPMIVAEVPDITSTCVGGTVTANPGSGTISYVDGSIPAGTLCVIEVNVTASAAGVYTNTTGNIDSEYGTGGTATDDLTVATTLPGFNKSFAPSSVPLGDRSTLTFLIDNSANGSGVNELDFTDNLPIGMVIADPPNASTNCGTALIPPVLSAAAGTSVIILDANGIGSFPAVAAGATCTVTVDVVAIGSGTLGNVSGELLASFVTAGFSTAPLTVTTTKIALDKDFVDDPVPPGGTVNLDFRIDNFDRDFSATGVAFTDDLTTALAGLTFSSLDSNSCGGSVSGVGTTNVILSGGTIAAEGFCEISVSLTVPAATPGTYTNMTGAVTGTVDGSPVTGNVASDDLYVEPIPTLTKLFVGDPVNAGDTVVLQFTITNTSATSGATGITFFDELTDGSGGSPPDTTSGFLPFPVTVTLPPVPDPPCGAGSSLALVTFTTDRQRLALTGGNLAALGSCTFEVTVTIPATFAPGTYLNTTEEIFATVDGATRVGSPASDDLVVVAAPQLTKAFTDDPVAPGGTVTLEFSLDYSADSAGDATGVTFTDNLSTTLTGLAAASGELPLTGLCSSGDGSLTGTVGDTFLTFAGATLMPGETCTFSVTLDVPVGAIVGSYTNTTSDVDATVEGLMTTSPAASDDLDVAGLTFTKEFLGDPVVAGDTVTLRFTIDNIHPTNDATITFFTDDLQADLTGLAATGGPSLDTCGGSLSGTTFLIYTGGGVLTGQSCDIEVEVLVPVAAADGTYTNVTSSLSANQGGAVTIAPAVDDLIVNSTLLELTKEFTDDPVNAGDTVTLEFILTNLDAANAASSIDFDDDFGVALPGVTFDSQDFNDCGATVGGLGTDTLSVTGASLGAGGTCTIQVTLTVPAGTLGGFYTNTTDTVTGDIGGFAVSGDAASDDLEVAQGADLSITKIDSADPVNIGDSLTYTVTVNNAGPDDALNVAVIDTLPTEVSLVSTSGCAEDPNGVSLCSLGTILNGGSAQYTIVVSVDSVPVVGSIITNTAVVSSDTLDPDTGNNTATEETTVNDEADLSVTKIDSADPILAGTFLTYTITVTNAGPSDAVNVVATDTLPAGVSSALTTGCAEDPGGVPTCSLGTIAAGASKQYTIWVTVNANGGEGTILTNNVSVTSDTNDPDGGNNSASEDTTVTTEADLSITKTDSADPVVAGQDTYTYTVSVTNNGPSYALNVVATDTLPAGVTLVSTSGCSEDPAGVPTCSLSTIQAGFSKQYTIVVSVDPDTVGTITNNVSVTSDTTDPNSGNNATSEDTTVVAEADLSIAKSDDPDPVAAGGTLTYTLTVTNSGPSVATGVVVTDTFPTEYAPTGNTCSAAGSPLVWNVGTLGVGASASCEIVGTVNTGVSGIITNTATITSDAVDTNTGNNTALETTLVYDNHFSLDDVALNEGNSGTTLFSFTVSRTDNGVASSIDYQTADAAALAGVDYTAASGTVNFGVGGTLTQTVTISVTGETLYERDEDFLVLLSNPVTGNIANGIGVGTILNDDAPPMVFIRNEVVREDDGSAFMTVELSAPSGLDARVQFKTQNGTATWWQDYVRTNGSLIIPAGDTVGFIEVVLINDSVVEGTEWLRVKIGNPVDVVIGRRTARLRIVDDDVNGPLPDGDPTINFEPRSINSGQKPGLD